MEESRRARKKRLTRQRIISAAIRLFEQQGYDETTVAEIAEAADVDTKTFFNYFRTKAEVLFNELDLELDVLLAAIAGRRPEESPGQVLRRAVQEYATHRRPNVPRREPAELSAAARLALTTPTLQAKGLHLLLDLQQRIAAELLKAFPGALDPVTAAAMTGAVLGAIQQASVTSAQLGRSQDQLWEAAAHALDVATYGLLSAPQRFDGQ
ncbi:MULTISPECIES: TetR/AcrR family transcriptional regulator [Microbispora]|uniref:TetR family transcriptional regulator n=1 Tax=Microbispora siamensis TaxID=564413 RepID=A0ABQ4GNV7_9ACTN|nr:MULTISPECIES: TetR/AcrR family transcriptional regulator [Microbispora]OPG03680.1 TetR family transcriptional regulator [Microbispora sp. GKU 823]GIH63087.1 TetR family transcriptional regulator [Microbispora siamensis]